MVLKPFVPDAKVIAMINDLSVESLASLLCLSDKLATKFRQLVTSEYCHNRLEGTFIVDAWETDE